MIAENNVLVIDLDGTLCELRVPGQLYGDLAPRHDVVEKVREYKAQGFHVICYTSRSMRTYGGNIGRIVAESAPEVITWLNRHKIPFDEVHFGKPWPGRHGFYVDDRAIRPDEFVSFDFNRIARLLGATE